MSVTEQAPGPRPKLEEMSDFLTVEDVMLIFPGLGKNKIYELFGDGTFPTVKMGKRVYATKVGVQRMIEDSLK
jgi:hypothetical protein